MCLWLLDCYYVAFVFHGYPVSELLNLVNPKIDQPTYPNAHFSVELFILGLELLKFIIPEMFRMCSEHRMVLVPCRHSLEDNVDLASFPNPLFSSVQAQKHKSMFQESCSSK